MSPVSNVSVRVATTAGAVVLTPDWKWRVYNVTNSGLLNDAVFDVAVQKSAEGSHVWFATNKGVSALDLDDDTWTSYSSENSALAWDGVSDIAIDAGGTAWFATYGCGISTLSSDGQWQNCIVRNSDVPWSIVTTIVAGCRCGDRPAWLWFGTDGPGAGTFIATKTLACPTAP